ncbi:hypothetical protein HCN44_010935 [Aphidius gifuensis]|uniref:Bifunctional lysine-specific demethylase and histidyl-hydroxylase n=1 Tax=Aphidius gifuensis TaxID=684658 RepID=A0A834Y8A9_APHGI|nr:ribosomal oxygenase 1 [Aphidius gifuensis]XP_044003324.1 ribosomal oxygenase 1 [Aphidius gifuensis]XP_044003333.1 ribosomal oxygenase 1 [Aphidius gifuensis]XP_044003342.1 ribosomal oxygenase 1 [Aphidius gifuensis]KAF7998527.1 hypothetical protein HCN44_010935 [Aphidius gifuensis]
METSGIPVSAFAMYSDSKKRNSVKEKSKVKVKRKRSNSITSDFECNKTSTSSNGFDVSKNSCLQKKKTPNKLKLHDAVSDDDKTNKTSMKTESTKSSCSKAMKTSIKKENKKKKNTKITSCLSSPSYKAEENVNSVNPIEDSSILFSWLIHPMSVDKFFNKSWEKAPLHIKRNKANYYKLLMSTPMIDDLLRKYNILFTKNIDITSYSDGQRETHNPPGRALPSVVWDYYANGCSVRMLNPQTFIPKLHTLNASLQEYFGCFVGANSYLTPPDSQGFAPHYDDIEAFILQIEGKKRWRLYKPRNDEEYLPRYSSKNFDQSEIGEPILDVVVEAGDLLYFPRGTIHQGETIDGCHSLHITLSCYQKNSWGNFLEELVPEALKTSIECNSEFRQGLPLNYLNEIGSVHSKKNTEFRQKFIKNTKDLLHKMIDMIDIDKAADQIAKNHIHDFLPPVLAPIELECSALQDGERMIEQGVVVNRVEIEPDTRIRLVRAHCVRLVENKEAWRIYYSSENSKEYHQYELQFLELDSHIVPAVKKIIASYPDFVKVDDLPIEGEDNKVQVARDLWEKCIVLTDVPLPIIE